MKFREICNPQQNKTMERHKFHSRNQKQGETIESFISDLRIKAKACHCGELTDEIICDMILCGINSESLRKTLLRDSDLSLTKAISICCINEMTEENDKTLVVPLTPTNVDPVHFKQEAPVHKTIVHLNSPTITNCKNCGNNHVAKKEKCPANVARHPQLW